MNIIIIIIDSAQLAVMHSVYLSVLHQILSERNAMLITI